MSFLHKIAQTARTMVGLTKINSSPLCAGTTGTPSLLSKLSMAVRTCYIPPPQYDLLEKIHLKGPIIKKRKSKNPLGYGVPFARGVVLKTLVKKPKKPNSANRKCVLIRTFTGKELVAYVPGEGHNLQEHSVVLARVGRLRDVPGVRLKCVRGAYDLGHVIKKKV